MSDDASLAATTPPTRHRPAVVAYECVSALGANVAALGEALRTGSPALSPAPFDLPFPAVVGRAAAELPALPASLRRFDTRTARLALAALDPLLPTIAALKAKHGSERIGVVVGSSTGGIDRTEATLAATQRGEPTPAYSFESQHVLGALAELVRAVLAISGPVYTVSSACSSATKAVASGARLLAANVCDVVVVGGADCLCEMTLRGFHALGVLDPRGARPFSADRAGTHLGEGAAWFVLARQGDARLRLAGCGESSDAGSMTTPDADGRGIRLALARALRQAGFTGAQLDYANAHGTGTIQSDKAEAIALAAELGPAVPVSSTKGLTGHALGAAGAIELAITALAIERGELPPNAPAGAPDPACGVRLVATLQRAAVRRALSVSAGFGGANAVVIWEAA